MTTETIYAIDKELKATGHSKEYILFGAGKMGLEFLAKTSLIESVIGIFDNNPAIWGTELAVAGCKVSSPEKIFDINKGVCAIIASQRDFEIAEQLEKVGIEDWVSIPYIIEMIGIQQCIQNKRIESCLIESTSYCNANCVFCANAHMKRKKCHMERSTFEQIIHRFKEEGIEPGIFRLHLCGEPLMDPDIFYKVKRLKREFPHSQVGYTTNFCLGTPEVIRQILSSGQDYIVCSLNAIEPESYFEIMKTDYNRTRENVLNLVKLRNEMESSLEIVLSIVENEKNSPQIKAFEEYWNKMNVNVRIMREGKWLDEESKSILYAKRDNGKLKSSICPMIYNSISVLSNGDYAMCCFDAEGVVGDNYNMNIYSNTVDEVMHEKMKIIERENTLDICRGCSFKKE